MSTRKRTKYINEGRCVAEGDVELIEDATQWAPYLSFEDAEKLDDGLAALVRDDVASDSKQSRVFTLQPVAASR